MLAPDPLAGRRIVRSGGCCKARRRARTRAARKLALLKTRVGHACAERAAARLGRR
jgi:hypothetical protein